MVLNPVGDVLDPATGRILAGVHKNPGSSELANAAEVIRAGAPCEPLKLANTAEGIRAGAPCEPLKQHNTTLCVVGTNAGLSRVEAEWIAEQALVSLARLIDPPFTRHDGDVVFCVSTGNQPWELHRVALLARDATAMAIEDACRSAEPAGGLPTCHGIRAPF